MIQGMYFILTCRFAKYLLIRSSFRIFFSKTSNTWRLEDDDGAELEYDAAKGSWVPIVSSNSATVVDTR
jgi:hypothetical protein